MVCIYLLVWHLWSLKGDMVMKKRNAKRKKQEYCALQRNFLVSHKTFALSRQKYCVPMETLHLLTNVLCSPDKFSICLQNICIFLQKYCFVVAHNRILFPSQKVLQENVKFLRWTQTFYKRTQRFLGQQEHFVRGTQNNFVLGWEPLTWISSCSFNEARSFLAEPLISIVRN